VIQAPVRTEKVAETPFIGIKKKKKIKKNQETKPTKKLQNHPPKT